MIAACFLPKLLYGFVLINGFNYRNIADPILGVCVSIDPYDMEFVFWNMLTIIDFLSMDEVNVQTI